MPTYDYRCTQCANRFEVNRQMGDPSEECCPNCGAPAKRVFTPVGVSFKGSGFHNTDYRPSAADKSEPACPAKKDGAPACTNCPAAD